MPEPLLAVDGLSVTYPVRRGALGRVVGHVRAVDRVSFDVGRRETLGLVGESGCGKSSVGMAVLGLNPAASGRVRFDGREVLGAPREEMRRMRRRLQVVFQDPFGSLNPRMRVGARVGEGPAIHGIGDARKRRDRVAELLRRVGLSPDAAAKYPHEFSGGQRQRIAIARALAVGPEFVVCDEPVSALDVSVQAQILNLLGELQEEFGLSYLFIAHDLAVVRRVSRRVAVMYLGRIVEFGEARDLFGDPRHPYTKALLASVPAASPEERGRRKPLPGEPPSPLAPPTGCPFHPRCPLAESRCATEPQAPVAVGPTHWAACWKAAPG